MINNRLFDRITLDNEVVLNVQGNAQINAQIYNISETGLAVKINADRSRMFQVGDNVTFHFNDNLDIIDKNYIVQGKAKIIHINKYIEKTLIIGMQVSGENENFREYVENKKKEVYMRDLRGIQ